jgi:hypothetical protein
MGQSPVVGHEFTPNKPLPAGVPWAARKAYSNGVVIWQRSWRFGNGFGNHTEMVALDPKGVVVGHYLRDPEQVSQSIVWGVGTVQPQWSCDSGGRPVSIRNTRLVWVDAVKALKVD